MPLHLRRVPLHLRQRAPVLPRPRRRAQRERRHGLRGGQRARRRGRRARGAGVPGGHARGGRPRRGRHQGQVPRLSPSRGGWASTSARRRWHRGLHGLFIEEVTVHTFTQKFCHRLGFVDTGFLLAYSPATMAFEGIAGEASARRSVILGFKYLTQPHADARVRAQRGTATRSPASTTGWGPGSSSPPRSKAVAQGRAGAERERQPQALRWRRCASPCTAATSRSTSAVRCCGNCATTSPSSTCTWTSARPAPDAWRRPSRTPGSCSPASCPAAAPATGCSQYFNGVLVDYDAIQVEEPATADLLGLHPRNDRTQR